MRFKYFVFLACWIHASCSESEVTSDEDRLGLHYFPLEVGDYRIYEVEETKYTVLEVTTDLYQLKEAVVDSGRNASDKLIYKLHRSTRASDNAPWHLDSVWTAQKDLQRAVVVENNLPLIKMVFPIDHHAFWNANALNAQGNEFYRYDTNIADTLFGEALYQNLVKVIQNEPQEDFLGLKDSYEIYAPHVGLLIKKSTILNYCQEGCETVKEIQSGRQIAMTLTAYGKE